MCLWGACGDEGGSDGGLGVPPHPAIPGSASQAARLLPLQLLGDELRLLVGAGGTGESSQGKKPQDSDFKWPLGPRSCCQGERSSSPPAAVQPLVPRSTHLDSISSLSWYFWVFPAAPGGHHLNCQYSQHFLVHPLTIFCCCPPPCLESSLHPTSPPPPCWPLRPLLLLLSLLALPAFSPPWTLPCPQQPLSLQLSAYLPRHAVISLVSLVASCLSC